MVGTLFAALLAPALPASIGAPEPFSTVLGCTQPDPQFVAPGVSRADYVLHTADGPLVVHVVAFDPRESTLHFDAVLANDRLVSSGETVSSMANRTGAVAGINADYFDIGATNQPLNVVVSGGTLLRSPSSRAAFWVTRARKAAIGALRFSGEVRWNDAVIPLSGIDVWPPERGASLLLPQYGRRTANAAVVTLPLDAPFSALDRYRVAESGPGAATLALGPSALALATPPPPGTTVSVRVVLDPALDTIAAAIGGGPQLLRDGSVFADPSAPAPEETNRRFPLTGAGIRSDGSVLLVAVDGRRPDDSIGLTRPQFGALFLGMGARDALAFDSGGSSTLVARILGDTRTSVLNVPSDGEERRVADGFFVYSDAPRGRPDHLVLRPALVRALPGARVPLEARIVDAAGHAFGNAPPLDGAGRGGRVDAGLLSVGPSPGSYHVPVRAGSLRATLPVTIVSSLHRLRLLPDRPNPEPHATIALRASGEDATGNRVETNGTVRFEAIGGTIGADGVFRAGERDGVVTARAGGATARLVIAVGRRVEPLAIFRDPSRWRFVTAPAGAPGSIALEGEILSLSYDLSGTVRAAYAETQQPLIGEPVAFELDVLGDGSGVALRARFTNRFGEPVPLTLAKHLDWSGWRRVHAAIPGTLNPPITLAALYVVPTLGGPPVRVAGNVAFKSPALVEPGTP